MNRVFFVLVCFCCLINTINAQQPFSPVFERTLFSFASPGAYRFGLYGTDNPALLSSVHDPDVFFSWWDKGVSGGTLSRWGLYGVVPHVGVGVTQEKTHLGVYSDYNLALSIGDRSFSTGLSYGWTTTDNPALDKSSILTFGAMYRPFSFLSLGGQYTQALQTDGWELGGDIAVRPFSTPLLTIFTEYYRYETPLRKENLWSAGCVVEPLSGIRFSGRYFSNDVVSIGIHFSIGRAGFETQKVFNQNGNQRYTTYGIRLGAYDRTVLQKLLRPKTVVPLDLNGPIGYQRYQFFDRTKTLKDLLTTLEAMKDDPSVVGVAINTSGMEIDRTKLWELREKLSELKSAGKKVFIFIDRGNIDLYHFATVADTIVMDPYGILELSGYVHDRTYFKGTLDKIGLGFREFRLFKYKSAVESYSRDSMSDGDREQWQRILESWYSDVEHDICLSRSLNAEQLKTIVDTEVALLPERAKALHLIDVIGRWDSVKALVKTLTGKENSFTSPKQLSVFHEPYDAQWGEPPAIALVYALGACDMDEGIRARTLAKDLEDAYNDSNIKAIVLRIDSPGGDALASDYIARIIKQNRGKKPLIVSQGFVAGSGGYWLSMYGDTIVSTPGTLTGSIGVISGWIYNKGMKESLGLSTDKVTVGAHADLFSGVRLPLLNIQIPDRDMTEPEVGKVSSLMMILYKQFTMNVAEGRKLQQDYVDSVGQGRVWTGRDAKEKNLVDVLGGLDVAIRLAKERAGIPQDANVAIVEKPQRGLFNLELLTPRLLGLELKTTHDSLSDILLYSLKHNGDPLMMVPLPEYTSLLRVNERITR